MTWPGQFTELGLFSSFFWRRVTRRGMSHPPGPRAQGALTIKYCDLHRATTDPPVSWTGRRVIWRCKRVVVFVSCRSAALAAPYGFNAIREEPRNQCGSRQSTICLRVCTAEGTRQVTSVLRSRMAFQSSIKTLGVLMSDSAAAYAVETAIKSGTWGRGRPLLNPSK
jgi:hypothetical protein